MTEGEESTELDARHHPTTIILSTLVVVTHYIIVVRYGCFGPSVYEVDKRCATTQSHARSAATPSTTPCLLMTAPHLAMYTLPSLHRPPLLLLYPHSSQRCHCRYGNAVHRTGTTYQGLMTLPLLRHGYGTSVWECTLTRLRHRV